LVEGVFPGAGESGPGERLVTSYTA
jgi:hypothetical protein